MSFKTLRFADRLLSAPAHRLYGSTHAVIGGTGAVGGTTVLRMVELYEELMTLDAPGSDEIPTLLATGKSFEERNAFRKRVDRFLASRGGEALERTARRDEFITPSGILLSLPAFEIAPFPALSRVKETSPDERGAFVRQALASENINPDAPDAIERLIAAVRSARHFGTFLSAQAGLRGVERFRSVIVGIPLPSLVAYTEDWRVAAEYLPGITNGVIEELRTAFEEAVSLDIENVQKTLADEVVIAHTTSVGGMYDEVENPGAEPRRTIRLGFSHSAKDENLKEKQKSAERLTAEYSSRGIKVFITAAAIGIDDVLIRKEVPVQRAVRAQLQAIADRIAPRDSVGGGERKDRRTERKLRRQQGGTFPVPMGQVRVFRPLDVPLDAAEPEELPFEYVPTGPRPGRDDVLRPAYALRSGENGVFTVANADALYRVMRVASASELASVLATVCMFGDDPQCPFFPGGVCYYTETDNSRQVFDFLAQPALRQTQLSGLEPMALQDLGSAKHQGELHTLGLLILLHRVRTLDLEAIPAYVDAERFDAREFFERHSRPLTFEDVREWQLESLAADLRTLVSADRAEALEPLNPSRTGRDGVLFPDRQAARTRVFEEVLRAVRAIPSLGSPIIYDGDAGPRLRSGTFVAPIETVITSTDGIAAFFGERVAATGNSYEDVRDFYLCAQGFIDLRAHAIVCTAKRDDVPLADHLVRARDDDELRAALARVPPYGFFCTCGLGAVLFRLRALYDLLGEAMLELGTLQDFRWQMPRDVNGHILVLPGVVEAMRMVSEGLEKTTGTERLDGFWGYERRRAPTRSLSVMEPVAE